MLEVFGLVSAMLLLALVPSASVFAVVARALTSGFWQGAAMAIGIALGDCLFILCAVFGLAAMAEQWAVIFALLKGVGVVYLLFLGVSLWRAKPTSNVIQPVKPSSLGMSLLGGFVLTVGDPKAILFYVSFFPAYVDLTTVTGVEILGLCAIALLTVGGSKGLYAFMAHQSRSLFQNPIALIVLNRLGGIVMIATAVIILADLKLF